MRIGRQVPGSQSRRWVVVAVVVGLVASACAPLVDGPPAPEPPGDTTSDGFVPVACLDEQGAAANADDTVDSILGSVTFDDGANLQLIDSPTARGARDGALSRVRFDADGDGSPDYETKWGKGEFTPLEGLGASGAVRSWSEDTGWFTIGFRVQDQGQAGDVGDVVSVWVRDADDELIVDERVVLDGANGNIAVSPPRQNLAPLAKFSIKGGTFNEDQTVMTITEGQTVTFDASASWDTDGPAELLSFEWNFGEGSPAAGTRAEDDGGRQVTHEYVQMGPFTPTLTITDAAGGPDGTATCASSITVQVEPDGDSIAPPIDPSEPTTVAESTEFLFTGSDPVQVDVPEGTIEPARAGVIRGFVADRDGDPLEGVQVSIQHHDEGDTPEDENYGHTLSRSGGDAGEWDLAVNAGALLTVNFDKEGFLPVQRQIDSTQGDWSVVESIVMVEEPVAEGRARALEPDTDDWQVYEGPVYEDDNGSRHETLLFPPDNAAKIELEDGSTEPLGADSWSVGVTEYTVGASGPNAMPGPLPPQSRYTYAAEYSIAEADDTGAISVEFDEPVVAYLENFREFSVGDVIPMGYYDTSEAAWIGEPDGLVVEYLGDLDTDGFADFDLDGDGSVDDPNDPAWSGLALTDPERQQIEQAELFTPNTSFWRNRLFHFSRHGMFPADRNVPGEPGTGGNARSPNQNGEDDSLVLDPTDRDCKKSTDGAGAGGGYSFFTSRAASAVGCESGAVYDTIPLAGMAEALHYNSDRAPGSQRTRQLDIRATGDELPDTQLNEVLIDVEVGGRIFEHSRLPSTNLREYFTWDGRDAYGRLYPSELPYAVSVGYAYPVYYALFNGGGLQWTGDPSDPPDSWAIIPDVPFDFDQSTQQVILRNVERGSFGIWDAQNAGLGGWTLSSHHTYDPSAGVLHLGTGEDRRLGADDPGVIEAAAGCGPDSGCGPMIPPEGGDAGGFWFPVVGELVAASDGTIYFSGAYTLDYQQTRRVYRLDIDANHVEPVAGLPEITPYNSETGELRLAVGPDDSLYVTYPYHPQSTEQPVGSVIRRLAADGTVSIVAGNGERAPSCTYPPCGDSEPATETPLHSPRAITVADDGVIYFAEGRNPNLVRAVHANGTLSTIAGTGVRPKPFPATCDVWPACGDGGPAKRALLEATDLEMGPDGELVILDAATARIRAIDAIGVIDGVAGNGSRCWEPEDFCGDGGPALDAAFGALSDISVSPSGSVIVRDLSQSVRRIDERGLIRRFAGRRTDNDGCAELSDWCGNGSDPLGALLHADRVAYAPDGDVVIADRGQLRVVASSLPEVHSAGAKLVASLDGSIVYEFSPEGRHLTTRDGTTGAVLLTFDYQDYEGRQLLVAERDPFGNTTTIERDLAGNVDAIVSPFGQRADVVAYPDGWIKEVTEPGPNGVLRNSVTYEPGRLGLMKAHTDPRDAATTFGFTPVAPENDVATVPAGGVASSNSGRLPGSGLGHDRVRVDDGTRTTLTSAGGTVERYDATETQDGSRVRGFEELSSSGGTLRSERNISPAGVVEGTAPDGSTTYAVPGWDERWGRQVEFAQAWSETSASGATVSGTEERSVVMADPADPFSVTSRTTTSTAVLPSATAQAERTTTNQDVVTVASEDPDVQRWRSTATSPEGRTASSMSDGYGRMRTAEPHHVLPVEAFYDSRGRVERIVQGGRETSVTYYADDTHGRGGQVRTSTDLLNRATEYFYDSSGLLERVDLPGESGEWSYVHDHNGNTTDLTTPAGDTHHYEYTEADQLLSYTTPSGARTWTNHYNADGRLESVTRPDGLVTFDHHDNGWLDATNYPGGTLDVVYDSDPGEGTGLPPAGRVVRSVDTGQGSELQAGYDPEGRPATTTLVAPGIPSQTTRVTYDADWQVDGMFLDNASGSTPIADIVVDRDGLPTEIGDLSFERDTDSGRLEYSDLAGYRATPTYDSDHGELDRYEITRIGSGAVVAAWDYERDDLGRVTRRTEGIGGSDPVVTDYIFDPDTDTLDEVKVDGVTVRRYGYDRHGNRTEVEDVPAGTLLVGDDIVTNVDDQLVDYGDLHYTYRPNGEPEAIADAGNPYRSFVHDGLGRLTSVTLEDTGEVVSYGYDPAGNRVSRSVDGTRTDSFVYGGGPSLIAWLEPDGSTKATFVYAESHIPAYMERGGKTYAFLTDQIGTVRAVLDVASGDIVQELVYDEYGNLDEAASTGDRDLQPFGWAGSLRDDLTGYHHMGARDYDPHAGRFLQPDPIGQAGDTNLYRYGYNDPANLIDPDGLQAGPDDLTSEASGLRRLMQEGRLKEARELIDAQSRRIAERLRVFDPRQMIPLNPDKAPWPHPTRADLPPAGDSTVRRTIAKLPGGQMIPHEGSVLTEVAETGARASRGSSTLARCAAKGATGLRFLKGLASFHPVEFIFSDGLTPQQRAYRDLGIGWPKILEPGETYYDIKELTKNH